MPYLDYHQSNGYLLPPYLEELIPVDHAARVVNREVDLLDIQELTSQGKVEGCPAYHPRMMLKILIYAYSQKTPSSCVIAKKCAEEAVQASSADLPKVGDGKPGTGSHRRDEGEGIS